MFRFLLDFCPSGHFYTSFNSVEIKSVLMSFPLPDALCAIGRRASRPLTILNFKNGWNASTCSSSTLAINPCVFANYPSKKWNTPVPLFHQNQSIFFRNNADFNNSLTKLPLSPYSVEINPAPAALTLFNSKNGCPTSPGTGTLCRQPPMFHPLNPFKTVPPLGHFSSNSLTNKLKCPKFYD